MLQEELPNGTSRVIGDPPTCCTCGLTCDSPRLHRTTIREREAAMKVEVSTAIEELKRQFGTSSLRYARTDKAEPTS